MSAALTILIIALHFSGEVIWVDTLDRRTN